MAIRLIAGLGNPGTEYSRTRHNAGFWVVERLVEKRGASWRDRFRGLTADFSINDQKLLILKPQEFMNRSGGAVQEACSFFKIAISELLIVHDELDLPCGVVRLKVGGGHGGHNGLRSIGDSLGSYDFVRLRIGIGRPNANKAVATSSVATGSTVPQTEALITSSSELSKREDLKKGEAVVSWVLGRPGVEERKMLDSAIEAGAGAIVGIFETSIESVQKSLNRR